MGRAHAILSPSGASRWMSCTPSARLEEQFPESSSTFADEGTYAHAVGELILRDPKDFKEQLEKLKNSKLGKLYHSDTLYAYADEYADYVRGYCTKGSQLFIEQGLDLSKYIPEGFGTGDAIVIRDAKGGAELHQFDLKYGQGVEVSAVDNPQLKIYGLGALEEFDMLYDIETVHIHIYQPRIGNISSWSIPAKDLREWGEKQLKPTAKIAWDGKGEYQAGEHCRFCKVGAQCRALAEHNLQLARNEFFGQDPEGLMTIQEVASVLEQAETLVIWTKLLAEYAYQQALAGEKVPGYKLVEGRSIRKYSDEAVVKAELLEAGFSEQDITTKPALLGITAMQKAVKKKAFDTIVAPLLIKPEGAPTLVKESDKRPEWSSAGSDFKDLID